jgi:hypothetical protein
MKSCLYGKGSYIQNQPVDLLLNQDALSISQTHTPDRSGNKGTGSVGTTGINF